MLWAQYQNEDRDPCYAVDAPDRAVRRGLVGPPPCSEAQNQSEPEVQAWPPQEQRVDDEAADDVHEA